MSCIGNFGISAVVKENIVINQQLHAFLESEMILPKFLMYHIRILKNFMNNLATSTTIAYLNKTNCNSLPINCPAIEEQKEIVKRIETLFNYADKIEEEIKAIEKQIENFNQSVLFKAFRGDLVPQDSNDEPPWQLLERIKAEKSQQPRLKGSKKKS